MIRYFKFVDKFEKRTYHKLKMSPSVTTTTLYCFDDDIYLKIKNPSFTQLVIKTETNFEYINIEKNKEFLIYKQTPFTVLSPNDYSYSIYCKNIEYSKFVLKDAIDLQIHTPSFQIKRLYSKIVLDVDENKLIPINPKTPELIIVMCGKITIDFGNFDTLKSNDVFLFISEDLNLKRQIRTIEKAKIIKILVDIKVHKKHFSDKKYSLTLSQQHQLNYLLNHPVSNDDVFLFLNHILFDMITSDKSLKNKRINDIQLLRSLVEFIHQSLKSPHSAYQLTVELLSFQFDVSRSKIQSLFNHYLNCRPKQYILNLKICYAKKLLRTTNLTISQISFNLGYLNSQSFTRAFKFLNKITPSQYLSSIQSKK